MRIHGKKTIIRRKSVKPKKYPEYREELEEDFCGLCGYCGKNQYYFYERFQIDHFAPKSLFEERENDYNNLVLSCPQCNRHKSNKWVTKTSNVPIEGNEGFVDPATKQFDLHLYRKENGTIGYNTEIGKYMYNTFKFDIRPMSMIWKIHRLHELKESLKSDTSKKGLELYKAVDTELENMLRDIIFKKRE